MKALLFFFPALLSAQTFETRGTQSFYFNQLTIEKGEEWVFEQENREDSIYCYVNDQNPALIKGSLLSNGNIVLVAPGGIVISPTGRIETAGITATTLNVPIEAFTAHPKGPFLYSGSSEFPIINLGNIKTSLNDLRLISCYVLNKGMIEASDGRALISSLLSSQHLSTITLNFLAQYE